MFERFIKFISFIIILLTLAILVFGILSSIGMVGKPFAGFLMKNDSVVNHDLLWNWTGSGKNLQYLDVVLAVNGEKVSSSQEIFKIIDAQTVGSPLNYLLRHSDGKIENISIPTMRFEWLDYLFSFGLLFIIAIIWFASAVATYLKRPGLKLSFVFLFLSSIFAIMLSTLLGARMMPPFGWIFSVVGWSAQFILGASLINFALVFLDEKDFFRKRRYLQLIPYLIALPALGLFLYASNAQLDFAFILANIVFSLLYIMIGIVFMFVSFFYLSLAGRSSLTRQRANLFFWGTFMGTSAGLLGVIFALMHVDVSLGFVLLPTIFLPLIFAYNILRYDPFEVNSVIRKVLSAIVIIGLIIVTYNFIVFLFEAAGSIGYRSPVFLVLFVLFFLFNYDFLDRFFGRLVARYVFGSKVDLQSLIGKISDQISTLLDIHKISQTVKTELLSALRLKYVEILLIYPGEKLLRNEDGSSKLEWQEDLLRVIELREGKEISIYDFIENPIYLDVSEECTITMRKLGAELIIPLMFRDALVGLLILGEREEGTLYYTLDEIAFLRNLAFQIAVALENAKIYENLANSKKDIENMHSGLEKKVEEQTAELEEKSHELDRLNDDLQVATKRKTEFLANMSHELRTPLNAILGFSTLIQDGVYGNVPDKVKEALGEIEKSGSYLLGLINEVLNLPKVESGKIDLKLEDFKVKELIDFVRSSVTPLLNNKGLFLKIEIEKDLPSGYGDQRRISEVMINLIGNSAKFTPDGGITLSVKRKEKVLLFEVIDTGVGISKEKLPDVFKEYKRAHTDEFAGTGLGLAITKKFIELHGGKIWAESEEGKGSVFRFTIPLRKAEEV